MNALWSAAKAKVSHRLATHFCVEPFRLRNETPMVSFTFDDIPKSAATTGAGILEDHGARGTFYVSGGLVGTTSSPDWAAVDAPGHRRPASQGHEIGCHTFSHQRACDLDAASMAAEIEQNRRYLAVARSFDQDRELRLPVRLRVIRAQAPAQGSVPVLPQHRAGREQRHRGPAIPSRDALDRPSRSTATRSSARSTKRKPITDG